MGCKECVLFGDKQLASYSRHFRQFISLVIITKYNIDSLLLVWFFHLAKNISYNDNNARKTTTCKK